MNEKENSAGDTFTITVSKTSGRCPIGEKVGGQCQADKSIPVVSCEGACIRGEIARLAANYVAKRPKFKRGCHGELFTVPESSIAQWISKSDKIVCIDGCFLRCQSRILENQFDPAKLMIFDALSFYKKYSDIFDADDVPEDERKQVAAAVGDWVLKAVESELAK